MGYMSGWSSSSIHEVFKEHAKKTSLKSKCFREAEVINPTIKNHASLKDMFITKPLKRKTVLDAAVDCLNLYAVAPSTDLLLGNAKTTFPLNDMFEMFEI